MKRLVLKGGLSTSHSFTIKHPDFKTKKQKTKTKANQLHSSIHACSPLTLTTHTGRNSAVGVHGVFQHGRKSLDAPPAGARGLFAPSHRTPKRTNRGLDITATPASLGRKMNSTFHVSAIDHDGDGAESGNRRETFRWVVHPGGRSGGN